MNGGKSIPQEFDDTTVGRHVERALTPSPFDVPHGGDGHSGRVSAGTLRVEWVSPIASSEEGQMKLWGPMAASL